jgi:hypothetical protein
MSDCKVLYIRGHGITQNVEEFPEVARVLNRYLQAGYKIVSMFGAAVGFYVVLTR